MKPVCLCWVSFCAFFVSVIKYMIFTMPQVQMIARKNVSLKQEKWAVVLTCRALPCLPWTMCTQFALDNSVILSFDVLTLGQWIIGICCRLSVLILVLVAWAVFLLEHGQSQLLLMWLITVFVCSNIKHCFLADSVGSCLIQYCFCLRVGTVGIADGAWLT